MRSEIHFIPFTNYSTLRRYFSAKQFSEELNFHRPKKYSWGILPAGEGDIPWTRDMIFIRAEVID